MEFQQFLHSNRVSFGYLLRYLLHLQFDSLLRFYVCTHSPHHSLNIDKQHDANANLFQSEQIKRILEMQVRARRFEKNKPNELLENDL